MSQRVMMDAVSVLQAYARGAADQHDVFRALLSHNDWLVPEVMLQRHYQVASSSEVWGESSEGEYPPQELWLFTDVAAAERALQAGSRLGKLGLHYPALAIFSRLDPSWLFIRVNPVSPAEFTWNFPSVSFRLIQTWCLALQVEQALAGQSSHGATQQQVVQQYPYFSVFLLDDGSILTMPNQANMKNPAVVLTTPDCTRQILKSIPEALKARLKTVETTGAELLQKLPSQGVDGLLVNPAGPSTTFAVQFHLKPESE